MPQFIESARSASAAGPGLSYALGAKLFGVPLYMAAPQGERLRQAIEQRAFDAATGDVSASKFIGSFDQRSRFRVTEDGIAIVSIQGLLIDRGAFLGDVWGWFTSYEGITEQCRRLTDDSAITAVVLDIDSGGGMVAGIYDMCVAIETLAKAKPVYALAANKAASAAYATACVADEVYVTRSGDAGSIGVIQIHQSMGRMLDNIGVDTTIICEPAPKANGNPYNPLSHGARAEMSAGIASAYQSFVDHVARHRGMSADAVKATQAHMFTGSEAVTAGLADGVKSIDELLDHIRKGQRATRAKRKPAAVRGSTQKQGDGRMANNQLPDEGTNYDAVMADAMKALAQGHSALATVVQQKETAAPAPAAAAVPSAPAPAAAPAAAQPAPVAAAPDPHARVKAILDSDAAKDQPGLAKFLALDKPDISADLAIDILKVSAVETKAGTAATAFYAAVRNGGGSPQVPNASADTAATKTRAEANIERQAARFAKKG